ncbi:MAG: peptidoglycan amidohydrolase family protein [Coriobacteriales bacterium]|nr:peptidoglycan amidohydrolase family protein [Coriobacteriales bacterium]
MRLGRLMRAKGSIPVAHVWERRILATFVSVALVASCVPSAAFAQEQADAEVVGVSDATPKEPGQDSQDLLDSQDLQDTNDSSGDATTDLEPVSTDQVTEDVNQEGEETEDAEDSEEALEDLVSSDDELTIQVQEDEPQDTQQGTTTGEQDPEPKEDSPDGQESEPEEPKEESQEQPQEDDESNEKVLSISYAGSIRGEGWQRWQQDGATAGRANGSKLVEGLRIKLTQGNNKIKGVSYKAYVQGSGWTKWVSDGTSLGKKGKRIEAIKVKLSKALASTYDVVYRVKVDSYGWLSWTSNGSPAGSTGKSKRIVAIKVALQKKESPTITTGGKSYYDGAAVALSAHVEGTGWQKARLGKAGTAGGGLRIEAITARINDAVDYSGSIAYRSRVQGSGWKKYVKNGKVSGTTGKSKRIEAMSFKLTGQVSKHYDIYYRAYVQGIGWLQWAKNGQNAGSQGFSLRMESIQVRLVPKGSKAPSSDGAALQMSYVRAPSVTYRASSNGTSWLGKKKNGTTCGKVGGKALKKIRMSISSPDAKGSIVYQTRAVGAEWSAAVTNGKTSGNSGANIEAIRVSLSGDIANMYDVYYRVHAKGEGWLGWAKNGAEAGTGGYRAGIDAIKVKLVARFESGPSDDKASYVISYFDPTIRKESITAYLAYAVKIAEDDAHGYSQLSRWGPDYDCSSLVITSLREAGLPTGTAYFTGDMLENLRENGWLVMRYTTMEVLQRGDILLTPNDHTEFYLGDGKNVRAWMSEHGTIWGSAGDQTGHEIEVVDFHTNGKHGWKYVLRLK